MKNVQKINKVLASLEGLERAAPASYLQTRLNARLQEQNPPNLWIRTGAVLSRPLVATCVLLIFIIANIFVLSSLDQITPPAAVQTTSASKYDFAINISSIYDFENQEP